jgi:GNAT superfamily N-acetyltransferase
MGLGPRSRILDALRQGLGGVIGGGDPAGTILEAYDDGPGRLSKGLARHPVPILLLARLAVRSGSQGQGIGAGLLKDAMLRTLQAADIAGIRALAAHAKDENARRFSEHFGFIPSPTDALHLFLLVKDIKRLADH